MTNDKIFFEEKQSLEKIEAEIDSIASRYETKAEGLAAEIKDFRCLDYDDRDILMDMRNSYQISSTAAEQFRSYQSSPYFARLDLDNEENGAYKSNSYLIGKEGISDRGNIIVVDWRTPIGSCYYANNQKEFLVEDRMYFLALRRALDIKDAKLISYKTEYDGETVSLEGEVIDPFLLTVLKDKRRQNRLTDIIRTIQGNQNEIIRRPRTESFVVQGCAGSGKTMILLHRLSFLKFNHKGISFAGTKIITPNKDFDAHINDLSIELGLNTIERFSVEEYYASLIKRYSSKIPVNVNVHSEKNLNIDLLEELYSLQYAEDLRLHYENYWENAINELDLVSLKNIFDKFGIFFPDTSVYSYNTYTALQQGLSTINHRVVEQDRKQAEVEARLTKAIKESEGLKEECEGARAKLNRSRLQVRQRLDFEGEGLKKEYSTKEKENSYLKEVRNEVASKQKSLEAQAAVTNEHLLLFKKDEEAYIHYDKFVNVKDNLAEKIGDTYKERILKIKLLESELKKIPIYNFGKKNDFRKKLEEAKKVFSADVMTFMKITKEKSEQEQLDLPELEQQLLQVSERLDTSENELLNVMQKKNAIEKALIFFNDESAHNIKGFLNREEYEECNTILKTYIEDEESFNRISYRLHQNKKAMESLNEKKSEIITNQFAKDFRAYIEHCLFVAKRLQISEIFKNIMDKDTRTLYKKYNQKYLNVNYRYKLYLKLLFCNLYFQRKSFSADNFLNIDEAQDISIAEYKLLKNVLGDKCIFNLYGDINQSVYSYKGINDWEDISNVIGNNIYVLNENYRNTLQITDFCNEEFKAEVYPIGIHGDPVEEKSIGAAVRWIYELKQENPGFRVAIIHRYGLKDVQEFLEEFLDGVDVSWYSVNDDKLSIVSVETAKGLEFEAVVAIVDQMTDNEKYISYTRALEKLVVVRDSFSNELLSEEEDFEEEFFEASNEPLNLNDDAQSQTAIEIDNEIDDVKITLLDDSRSNETVIDFINGDNDDTMSIEEERLIKDLNAELSACFGANALLSRTQEKIICKLYARKSVAYSASVGFMKSAILYLLAKRIRTESGKQILITADRHLQENELILAERLGLYGGSIDESMEKFIEDFKREKYDVIFVPFDFFDNEENIEKFRHYFEDRIAYWGINHLDEKSEFWEALNTCANMLNATKYLMSSGEFPDFEVAEFKQFEEVFLTESGIISKHTLYSADEKKKWISNNLSLLQGQGLVYCDKETDCKEIAKHLRKQKIMAEAYIELTDLQKRERINYLTNSFSNGGLPVLVTTHDAGKNLTNPKIRFILHYDMPQDDDIYTLHVMQIGRFVENAKVFDLVTI